MEYYLGLTPSGVIVLRNKTTVAHYYWPRIGKVFHKGKYFMLRVCDKNVSIQSRAEQSNAEGHANVQPTLLFDPQNISYSFLQNEINTYGFETPKKVACKHLYRCCVEHHAFFRLVQTPLIPNGGADLYNGTSTLSNRFNSLPHHNRAPPTFTRLPSNRQLRRSFHDGVHYNLNNGGGGDQQQQSSLYNKRELHRVSIPQNLNQDENNNNNNNNRINEKTPGSPQSSRSMSRSRSQQRGLFGVAPSPRSVRSASRSDLSQVRSQSQNFRQRSSSVESQSSNDSRSCRRYKGGSRHRRQSDNESEMSRGSAKSGHSHHSHRKQRRHRSRRRNGDSGSENESMKSRNYSGHRASKDNYELVDSELQWREVQRKQSELKEITSGVQQAAVTKSSHHVTSSAKANSHTSSTFGQHHQQQNHHRSRKHRRHRSPGENGGGGGGGGAGVNNGGGNRHSLWNSELAKHLQFDLIDTTGMSEDQLREIPYTIVQTTTPVKLPSNSSLKVHKHHNGGGGGAGAGGGGLGGHRMDRIRP